jgi:hypothetical protein
LFSIFKPGECVSGRISESLKLERDSGLVEHYVIAQEESAMLLTGFESYGGRSLNPAEQVMKRLDRAEIQGVRVVGHTLPVDYRALGPASPS